MPPTTSAASMEMFSSLVVYRIREARKLSVLVSKLDFPHFQTEVDGRKCSILDS